ncbi:RusA family crossover junction endodeoxyribonuclease, partial [Butyricicoccus sp. 1XD8-22]
MEFTIDGDVQAQERPRFSNRGGYVKTYDPPKSRKYKEYVAEVAKEYAPEELIESEIVLTIDVYIKIPKSYTKKQRQEIIDNHMLHSKKPDVDNLAKGIKDGITGVIWKDDSQIVELHISKFYSEEPRAE